jgi:hypothetical protein
VPSSQALHIPTLLPQKFYKSDYDDDQCPPLQPYSDDDPEVVGHVPTMEKYWECTRQLADAAVLADATDATAGKLFASGTTNHTKKYTTHKKKLLIKFVNVLKAHPQKYASKEPIKMVFLLLCGENNKAEK